jgi:hypothetical protein
LGIYRSFWGSFTIDVQSASASSFDIKKHHPTVAVSKGFPDSLILESSSGSFIHVRRVLGQVKEVATDPITRVACFCVNGEWFSISDQDFVTKVYNDFRSRPVFRFRSYRGPIVCSAISEMWKVHVTAHADGALCVTSLCTGNPVRVIELGAVRPISVLISPGWGFIVTYGTEVEGLMRPILVVHTINGEFVRNQPRPRPPTAFTVFSSNRGFDYFAYTIRKQLYVCEVFYLGIKRVGIWTLQSEVRQLIYDRGSARFVLLDDKRQLHLVHYAPNDFEQV